ncbi:hypothetical protein V8C35DRAFT_277983 [Trichoderma chlorosporum]
MSPELAPADYGFPFESGSITADSEFLENLFSQLLPLSKEKSTSIGTAANKSDNVSVAIEAANKEAKTKKVEFVNILLAWDREHDHIMEKTKSQKTRGTLFRDKTDLITEVRSNILDTHGWKEVFTALHDAEQSYSNPKGIKVVGKWFRKAADKSGLIEPFVDFIPDSDFSSVICGGIKFILKACAASKKFREEAFNLINQLPEKADIACQYLEIYQNNDQLQAAAWTFAVQKHKDNLARQNMEENPDAEIPKNDMLLLLDPNSVSIQTSQDRILQQVLRNGFATDTEAQARVEWLMANKSIRHWLTSAKSKTLLVNGHGKLERVTPMSLFCAMLAQSFSASPIIVLTHFCGLQALEEDPQDPKRQKAGRLLRSLLIQLLTQWQFPDITCLKNDFVEKLKRTSPNWSLRQQKRLFHHLVAALPPATPIFIIIDGTNYYEATDSTRDDIKTAVTEANKLLSLGSVEAMVKILVTSPTRSFNLAECFETNEIVNVPEDIDSSMTKFSESNLRLQFESKATDLERSSSRKRHR